MLAVTLSGCEPWEGFEQRRDRWGLTLTLEGSPVLLGGEGNEDDKGRSREASEEAFVMTQANSLGADMSFCPLSSPKAGPSCRILRMRERRDPDSQV